jgi:hypothetical protein
LLLGFSVFIHSNTLLSAKAEPFEALRVLLLLYLYRDVEYPPPTPTTVRWKKKQVCKKEQIYTLLKLKVPSFYMVI